MTASRPQYREIAERLQAEILAGVWPLASRLPPEKQLAESLNVSRFTIREALSLLEDKGLVSRKRRAGTVVSATRLPEVMVQKLGSMHELLQYPPETHLDVLSSERVESDVALARLLGCETGHSWVRLHCIRQNPGHAPVCWTDLYIPEDCAALADRIGRGSRPVYRLMEDFGHFATDIEADLFAGTLSASKAKALYVPPGTATLVIVRRYRDAQGQLFEVSVSEHPASRFSYKVSLKRQPAEG
jgi:DNA-binding GntR family transcriptional regulator